MEGREDKQDRRAQKEELKQIGRIVEKKGSEVEVEKKGGARRGMSGGNTSKSAAQLMYESRLRHARSVQVQ